MAALAILFAAMFLGDALVSWQPAGIPQIHWALLDAPVHAAIAVLAVSPLLFSRVSLQQAVLRGLLAGFVTIMLDVDHFAAARTVSLYDALHLAYRPITHSLVFAILCGLAVRLTLSQGALAWSTALLLASHVLRDASTGGTPFLWPLSLDQISVPAYYVIHAGLYLWSAAIAGATYRNSIPRSPTPAPWRLCQAEARAIAPDDREHPPHP